jgi:hypothetical protein
MAKTALWLVTLATLFPCMSVAAGVQATASDVPVSTARSGVPRVRSDDPTLVALITQASEWSPTFRGFVSQIEATDGIVYVARRQCQYGVRACLSMNVTLAGPYRILRVAVDARKAGCDTDLMASIGHELWHAIEILREPTLRSYAAVFEFYRRIGLRRNSSGYSGAWETAAAIQMGWTVLKELRAVTSSNGYACKSPMCGSVSRMLAPLG